MQVKDQLTQSAAELATIINGLDEAQFDAQDEEGGLPEAVNPPANIVAENPAGSFNDDTASLTESGVEFVSRSLL